jgi:hypothetical protein
VPVLEEDTFDGNLPVVDEDSKTNFFGLMVFII